MKKLMIFIGLKISEILGVIIFYCLACFISYSIINYWIFLEDSMVWYHPIYFIITVSFLGVCFSFSVLFKNIFEFWWNVNREWTNKIYYKYFVKDKLE